MTLRLWLVRHGSTDSTDAGKFLGWKDEPLNAHGFRQAEVLRDSIKTFDFDSVWSSDLLRAVQTAELVTAEFTRDARLRELDLGLLEGKTWDECGLEVQQALLEFDHFGAPEGETVGHLRSRIEEFLSEFSEGDHLIVSHGGVIRVLLRQIEGDRTIGPGDLVVVDWTKRVVETPLSVPTTRKTDVLVGEQRQESAEAKD
jgi:probable phosphoglycerate mutase